MFRVIAHLLSTILLITLSLSTTGQNKYIITDSVEQRIKIKEILDISFNNDTTVIGIYSNDSIAYRYKLHKGSPSGIYRVFYPNGNLKYRTVFMNGKLNGSWKEFNKEGILIVTGNYNLGKKEGSWFYFSDQQVQVFKNGIARGRWRIYEGWTPRTLFVYKRGVLISTKRNSAKTSLFH